MTRRFSKDFWVDRSDAISLESVAQVSNQAAFESRFPNRPAEPVTEETPFWQHPDSLAIYLPENYEPNYAYPLIIWLHGAGGNEREMLKLMPQISTQNFLAVALRGQLRASGLPGSGYRWSEYEQDVDKFEEQLHETVCNVRREYHVHSERIFVAGFDDGGTLALRLLLKRPEWFGGAIALNGSFPEQQQPLSRYRDLQGKRVLIGAGNRTGIAGATQVINSGRLLHSAGIDVAARVYDAAHEITSEMLTDMNHWLMQGICEAVCST